jgi:hypothetical protein
MNEASFLVHAPDEGKDRRDDFFVRRRGGNMKRFYRDGNDGIKQYLYVFFCRYKACETWGESDCFFFFLVYFLSDKQVVHTCL